MKKKILTLAIILILELTLTITAYGYKGEVNINIKDNYIEENQDLEIFIKLKNLENTYGIMIYLEYDHRYIDPRDIDFNLKEALTKDNFYTALNVVDKEKKLLKFMGTSLGRDSRIGEGEILDIGLRTLKPGKTKLTIKKLELLDKEGKKINFVVNNKAITINKNNKSYSNRRHSSKIKKDIKELENTYTQRSWVYHRNVENLKAEEELIHSRQHRLNILRTSYGIKDLKILENESIELIIKYKGNDRINYGRIVMDYSNEIKELLSYQNSYITIDELYHIIDQLIQSGHSIPIEKLYYK